MNWLFPLLILHLVACGQPAPRVKVVIPTAEQEAAYVWRTLQDIPFFEANGYQVSLPQGPLIDSLKAKVRSNQLIDSDYAGLVSFMKAHVYQPEDYQSGYDRVTQEVPLLNQMVRAIEDQAYDWGFKSFEQYRVELTLYGPGGSYDPDEGSVLLYTTPDGRFKQYANPANTLIHEITHIGIEESIIRALDIPHGLKERIVDTFVSLSFGEQLPDYRIQPMGDEALNLQLKGRDDLLDLKRLVTDYMESR